jgi:hypothetical protein
MMPHRRGVLHGLARSLKARDIAIVLAGYVMTFEKI